ncbi:flagellar assembly protein FliW [Anaeromicrobium sediminis]|uniref:Flagellar assembly factor FliW n=1 Tax=Anaeromicrobium sediminis TaxID=1478221 RepID=A0A267MIK7_9FIRM|nr:flagellar assembly protein FliW [Anaeromicrobium sediminis]PAB59366.1 flagellar assembly protein FliW [Anaeromicrobium sediminis]
MFIETKHFGKIEIIEENIISFKDGLLGFEELKKYIYIENEDTENPFNWLQSLEEPELAFVVTNPYVFVKDYEFDIPEKIVEDLEIKEIKDVMIWVIAVVPENVENMTINLKGPVIMNLKNKRAKQMVVNSEKYSLKHRIFEQTLHAGDAVC